MSKFEVGNIVIVNDKFIKDRPNWTSGDRTGQTATVDALLSGSDRGYIQVEFADGRTFPYLEDEINLLAQPRDEFTGPARAIAHIALNNEVAMLRNVAVSYDELGEEAAAFRAEQIADALELILASILTP